MTRMLFRRARPKDTVAIYQLALNSGPGMTSLPKDLSTIEKRVNWSTSSFSKPLKEPEDEYYLFVLENIDNNHIVGVSAIESNTGHHSPLYSYKISKRTRICRSLSIRSYYELLALVNDNEERSEICTLFLESSYRHSGNGLLLSRARFLFMKTYQERFRSIVIAEMRGVSDNSGRSPFWDAIGQHFFHMSFDDATLLSTSTDKQFIADLVPRNSIYVDLLPPKARAVIGEPHPKTKPALKILNTEGFRFNNYIDIFDGGPTIEAPINDIRTIKHSGYYTIRKVLKEVSSKKNYITANTALDFRATMSDVVLNEEEKTCVISEETAALLQVTSSDSILITPMHF